MFNVSFGRAKVNASANKFIRNATAPEIAEAINIGTRQASKELGIKLKHTTGSTSLSGTVLRECNPDSFDKSTKTLSEKGKKGFNKIYGKQFGVTVDSKLKDLTKCAKNVALNTADEDGNLTYSFKYLA